MAGNAPHFHRLVIRGRHQFVAFVGESNTSHSCRMSFDDFWLSFSTTHRNTSKTSENETFLLCSLLLRYIFHRANNNEKKEPYTDGFHSRTVLSLDEVATRSPEGEKCTPVMASWWPIKQKDLPFEAKFQIFSVLSTDPEAGGRWRWKWGLQIRSIKYSKLIFLSNNWNVMQLKLVESGCTTTTL